LLHKTAIGLAILLFLVLAGLVVGPQLVDLDRYKSPIALQLTRQLGRPVELVGRVRLSLLPSPTVTARDVRVANPSGAAVPDMVRLRAVEVKPALWPLLSGRIEMRSAALIEPEVDLERLADGRANWQTPTATADAARGVEGGPPSAPSAPSAGLPINQFSIQNGAVTYRWSNQAERFEHLNADVRLDGMAGPTSARGSLVAHGAALSFEVLSGALGAAEMPLQVTVTTNPAAQLKLDAILAGAGEDRRVDGKLSFAADDLQAVLSTLAQARLASIPAQPVALSGDLRGTWQALALEHLVADLGPAHGEGSARLVPGTPADIAVTLSINRLDLDHWPAPHKSAAATAPLLLGSARAATPATAVAPPRAARADGIGVPRAINATLELGVEALLWHGGLVRQLRLAAALADGRLTIDRCSALLPGGSEASLHASGTTTSDGIAGEGIVEANADDLRSLLAWSGVSVARIPADRLRRGSLSSRFTLTGDRLDLGTIDAMLDTTRLSGAATVLLRQRPGIGLRLAADRFNLDAYWPTPSPAATASPAPPSSATPQAAASDHGRGAVDEFDANIDARVGTLSWHGQPLTDVHLTGSLQQGELTVRELAIGDVGGGSGKLSGVIAGLAEGKPNGQLAFDVEGPEFERLLRLVAPSFAAARSFGGFSLGGGLQSDGETLSLDADLQLLGGHAHVGGEVAPADAKIALDIDADHPSFAQLIRQALPTYRPAGGDPGAIKLAGHAIGTARKFTFEGLALAVGDGTLDGTVAVDLTGARPRLDIDAKTGDWSIDRLMSTRQGAMLELRARHAGLPPGISFAVIEAPTRAADNRWSREAIDLSALTLADVDLKLQAHSLAYGGWRVDQPVLAAAVSDGVLSLRRLTGNFLGGGVEASGTLGSAPVALEGQVKLRDADLKATLIETAGINPIDGRFDLDARLASGGGSAAELIARLGGDATLHARDGTIAGLDLKAISDRLDQHPVDLIAMLRTGAGGHTAFTALDGSFHLADGIAKSGDIRLRTEGGDAQAAMSVDLSRWRMDGRVEFRFAGDAAAPPLAARLDGALDQPDVIFEVNALEQYLSRQHAPEAKPPAHQP
jgi:uncharacterized protein involved in outer membrane biogenesis